MPARTKRQRLRTAQGDTLHQAYVAHGVEGYYRQQGSTYRNPHEQTIQQLLHSALKRWPIALTNVLDLACGSGEVTVALKGLGATTIHGLDPYTSAAYAQRVGHPAERLTFDDIAGGALVGRAYSAIFCSFALHLAELSRLPLVCLALSQVAPDLVILTPHKRPQIRPEWGWVLNEELTLDRVRARWYHNQVLHAVAQSTLVEGT